MWCYPVDVQRSARVAPFFSTSATSFVAAFVVLFLGLPLRLHGQPALRCSSKGSWSPTLQGCLFEGSASDLSPTDKTLSLLAGGYTRLDPRDTLKIHVRISGGDPRVVLLRGYFTVAATMAANFTVYGTTELVLVVQVSELQNSPGALGVAASPLTLPFSLFRRPVADAPVSMLFSASPLLRFTVVVHLHSRNTALGSGELALLAGLGRQCCPAASNSGVQAGMWCRRINAHVGAAASPVPSRTGWVYDKQYDFCGWPETLCSADGSLLKLSLVGGLNCSQRAGDPAATAAAVAALAAAPSLAWLDLSLSYLGLELVQLVPLLARQELERVALAATGLEGPIDFRLYGGGGDGSGSEGAGSSGRGSDHSPPPPSPQPVSSPLPAGRRLREEGPGDGSGGPGSLGTGSGGSCGYLAPPGRRLLVLSGNDLTGPLPACLAGHTTLVELEVDGNKLTAMPSDWSNATSLAVLDLSNNPALRGPLTVLPPGLARLDASNVALGGGLPALPSSLVLLRMVSAGLSGGLGSNWSDYSALYMVNLRNNALSGELPGSFAPSMSWLLLDGNRLTGTLPTTLPPNVTLSDNRLSGPLPSTQLSRSIFLDISRNNISGPLPGNMVISPKLRYLNLSHNALTGNLRSLAGALMGSRSRLMLSTNVLEVLDLSDNDLTGPVPEELYLLRGWVEGGLLDLSSNKFSGPLPLFTYLPQMYLTALGLASWTPPLLYLGGGDNSFTCPASVSRPIVPELVTAQGPYNIYCKDPVRGCVYRLDQWLASSRASRARLAAGGAACGFVGTVAGVGREPRLLDYSTEEILRMRGLPAGDPKDMLPLTIGGPKKKTGVSTWPTLHVITLALASFTGLGIVALGGLLLAKGWRAQRLRRQQQSERGSHSGGRARGRTPGRSADAGTSSGGGGGGISTGDSLRARLLRLATFASTPRQQSGDVEMGGDLPGPTRDQPQEQQGRPQQQQGQGREEEQLREQQQQLSVLGDAQDRPAADRTGISTRAPTEGPGISSEAEVTAEPRPGTTREGPASHEYDIGGVEPGPSNAQEGPAPRAELEEVQRAHSGTSRGGLEATVSPEQVQPEWRTSEDSSGLESRPTHERGAATDFDAGVVARVRLRSDSGTDTGGSRKPEEDQREAMGPPIDRERRSGQVAEVGIVLAAADPQRPPEAATDGGMGNGADGGGSDR